LLKGIYSAIVKLASGKRVTYWYASELPGIGIIITYAGDNGLDNKTKLDRTKRVVVTLGVVHQGVPEWA